MAKPKRPTAVSFPRLSLTLSSDGTITSTENIVGDKVKIIGQDPDSWKGKVLSPLGGDDYKATVSYKKMARMKPRKKRKVSFGIEGISVTIGNTTGDSDPPNVSTTTVIP